MIETGGPSGVELFQADYFLETGQTIDNDDAWNMLHTRRELWGAIQGVPVVGLLGDYDIDDNTWLSRPPLDMDIDNIETPEFRVIHPDGTTVEITEEEYDKRSFAKEVQEAKALVESQMSKSSLFMRRLFRRKFPAETMIEADLGMVV